MAWTVNPAAADARVAGLQAVQCARNSQSGCEEQLAAHIEREEEWRIRGQSHRPRWQGAAAERDSVAELARELVAERLAEEQLWVLRQGAAAVEHEEQRECVASSCIAQRGAQDHRQWRAGSSPDGSQSWRGVVALLRVACMLRLGACTRIIPCGHELIAERSSSCVAECADQRVATNVTILRCGQTVRQVVHAIPHAIAPAVATARLFAWQQHTTS